MTTRYGYRATLASDYGCLWVQYVEGLGKGWSDNPAPDTLEFTVSNGSAFGVVSSHVPITELDNLITFLENIKLRRNFDQLQEENNE